MDNLSSLKLQLMKMSFYNLKHIYDLSEGLSPNKTPLFNSIHTYNKGLCLAIYIYGPKRWFAFKCSASDRSGSGKKRYIFYSNLSHWWIIPPLPLYKGFNHRRKHTQQTAYSVETRSDTYALAQLLPQCYRPKIPNNSLDQTNLYPRVVEL